MGLMEDTYVYGMLMKKYKSFSVPAAKLMIAGSDILAIQEITVQNIAVSMSLSAASSATFSMNGDYNYEKGSFSEKLKSRAVLGKTVEVKLGYGSDLTTVFKGFVASLGISFDVEVGITYSVTALDARRLMMSDNKRDCNYKINNYTDAVAKIMKRYKTLCSFKMEETKDNLNQSVLNQNMSDYDFIDKFLIGSGKIDREFFIVGDTAYLRKPRGNGIPMMTLSVGEGLKSFQRNANYLNQKIQFMGVEEGTNKALKGEATAKSSDQQKNAVAEVGVVVENAPDCHSVSELKKRAESRARELKGKNNTAAASCVGLPEIVPGRCIKIDRVDSSVNRKYYVTGVTHNYSMGGFVTTMEMEGWN